MKLKPCPFCNCPPESLIEEATAASEIRGYAYQSCWIECPTCGAQGPVITVSDDPDTMNPNYAYVRDAWNFRVPA